MDRLAFKLSIPLLTVMGNLGSIGKLWRVSTLVRENGVGTSLAVISHISCVMMQLGIRVLGGGSRARMPDLPAGLGLGLSLNRHTILQHTYKS